MEYPYTPFIVLGIFSYLVMLNLLRCFILFIVLLLAKDTIMEVYFLCRGKAQSRPKSKERSQLLQGAGKAMTQLAGELFRKMGEDLDQIAKDYSNSLDTFIKQLPLQQHVDLKFLFFRLDFTEYYSCHK